MSEQTYQQLAARFPAESHKTKTIGGTALTYVDGEMVVSRLNEALGYDGWSFEVRDIQVLELEVWALGRITAYVGDRTVIREQAGGQIINRKRTGEIIELSNDIKGAVTDCLKKCATLLGVGLYLYDPQERKEVEQDMREAKRPGRATTKPADPPKAVAAAAVLTGAQVGITKNERAELEWKYADLAEDAVALGHQHAEKIAKTKPETLDDATLKASVEKLTAWVEANKPADSAA